MKRLSAEYYAFIRSWLWRAIADLAIVIAGGKCHECGATRDLEVHHLTYERFGGQELPEDLRVLCQRCHARQHHVADSRRWDRRVDAWATKRYGPNWRGRINEDFVEREFEKWLDRE